MTERQYDECIERWIRQANHYKRGTPIRDRYFLILTALEELRNGEPLTPVHELLLPTL